jgi:gamma-glutamylcyclotransferase (GGCT)/AIG2-like uncharacterized protein YtfP
VRFFVYGTLTDRERAERVVPDASFAGDAALEGLQRVEARYPTLVPGGSVAGRILETDYVDRLDAYEGVDRGLYVRVTVPADGGEAVATYVGRPERLGVEAAGWPGDGPFAERVERWVEENEVVVQTG